MVGGSSAISTSGRRLDAGCLALFLVRVSGLCEKAATLAYIHAAPPMIGTTVCVIGGCFIGFIDQAVTLGSFELIIADAQAVLLLEISQLGGAQLADDRAVKHSAHALAHRCALGDVLAKG